MTTRTLTAMFDTHAQATEAMQALRDMGFGSDAVSIHSSSSTTGTIPPTTPRTTEGTADRGFWDSLKDMFVPDEDRSTYVEGVRRGGAVLTVRAEETQLDQVMDVLEQHGAVDLDERERSWRSEGWTGTTGFETTTATTGATAAGMTAGAGTAALASGGMSSATATTGTHEAIPIVEETIRVGKREVGRGRVRVRSYVVETPIEESVTLREEHVDVERRTVDRPVTDADQVLFQERVIEATATGEEAVVAKDVRVREEVLIRKGVEERTETVRDSVRRTEVEVEDDRATRTAGTTTTTGVTTETSTVAGGTRGV